MIISPEPLFDLVRSAIDRAMRCVGTGETLIPFIMTDGDPGQIMTIVGDSIGESLALAQKQVDDFDARTLAYAFAYDGFISMEGSRFDAIFVEASTVGSGRVFVFLQRYTPGQPEKPATRVGNWAHLQQNEPRLRA